MKWMVKDLNYFEGMINIKIRQWCLNFPDSYDAVKLNSCRNYLEGFMDVAHKYNLGKNKSEVVFAGLMLIIDTFCSTDTEDGMCDVEFYDIDLLGYTYRLESPIFRKKFYYNDAKSIEEQYRNIDVKFPDMELEEKHLLALMKFAYDNHEKWNRYNRY